MRHTLRSHRLALVGVVIVLGLTACGTPAEPGASSPDTVATTVSTDRSPAVISVSGYGAGTNAAGASVAGEAAPTADSKMMWPVVIDYVWQGDTAAADAGLTAPAGAWFFPAGAPADAGQVAAVATLLGVEGEVRALPADQGGGYMVGPDDWSGPVLTVGGDGQQSWWYSGPGSISAVPDCVLVDPAISSDGSTIDTTSATDVQPATDSTAVPGLSEPGACEPPAPPADVPDAATAEARAREFFTSLGLDPSTLQFEVYADEWGANVTAWHLLDGMRAPLATSIGFGENGTITWASGFLATPQRGDDYPRIGVEAAVQRLNDQSTMWGWMPMAAGTAMKGYTPAADATPGAPAPEPMPVDTTPIVVTLTTAEASLEMVWSPDGSVWLVPGYRFTTPDGGVYSVIAIPEEYLAMVQPETVVDPVPVVEPVPVDTAVAPPEAPLTLDEAAALLVGLGEADATAAATAAGIEMRVIEIDGVPQMVTEDFRVDRYNVAVTGGVVTAVISNG